MLFDKKSYRFCVNCIYSAPMDEDTILCSKKGVLPADMHCLKFKYDPLKRTPPRKKQLDFSDVSNDDFTL